MYGLTENNKSLRIACLFSTLLISLTCCTVKASRPNLPHYWESLLQEHGFSTETPEQIIEASKSKSYFVRYIALQLLTRRIRDEAKPRLKEALDDPYVAVRWHAAHLLGTLGDKGGLERMQRDFAELVPRNGAREPADPNIAKDSEALKQWQRHRHYRIGRALEVAKVLAELGDRRGYELAATESLESALAAIRRRAIEVLLEIAKTNKSILAGEGKDPVAVLCAMAGSEQVRVLFNRIVNSASSLGVENGVRILTKAKDNPYQYQEEIVRAKGALQWLQAKTKTPAKNSQD